MTAVRAWRTRVVILAVVVLVAGTGAACTSGSAPRDGQGSTSAGRSVSAATSAPAPASSGVTLRVGGTRSLTGAERSYGPSVGTIPGAVYQPDVVVIGGGADSIVGALDNGLVWTVKGDAPGASRLAVGTVMVATAFATGRVDHVQRVGGDVQVVLAPASLTDVFRELHVSSSAPVTLQQPLSYSYGGSPLTSTAGDDGTPAAPTSASPQAPTPPPAPGLASVYRPLADAPLPPGVPSVALPAPSLTPKQVHEGKFTLTPFCCFPSQGVHISYNEPTGRMAATVGLVMGSEPLVDFHIDIDLGGLRDAAFQLHGPKAIEFKFDAATKDVSGNYRSPTFRLPLAFTFPVAGIPFTVSMTQSIHASIQLAGQADFSTTGEYAISGGLGFTYQDGSFGVTRPSFSSTISSLQNAASLSVGINALSIGYGAQFSVGIGVVGFNGGPFVDLEATLAIAKDGSPAETSLTAGCATAAVSVTGRFGVGYTIPEFVAEAVNAFLGLFHAAPIPARGGKSWGPYTLWNPGIGKRCLQR